MRAPVGPGSCLSRSAGALAGHRARWLQRWGVVLCVSVTLGAVGVVAPAPPPPPLASAVNWASAAAYGATAVASSAGYWAGFAAEAKYALDGDPATFWSSTGGEVCCSESRSAWLLVSLGAVRPLAALEFLHTQDMTFAVSLGNASAGPFVEVVRRTCDPCVMNVDYQPRTKTFGLLRSTAAAFVRLSITWSSDGGVGGCADMCDWATNIYEIRAFSPAPLPPAQAPPAPLPVEVEACQSAALVTPVVSQSDMQRGVVLSGDAVRMSDGSGMRGSSSLVLTPSEPHHFGAAEYTTIIRPAESCPCFSPYDVRTSHGLFITAYVRLGGSMSMPGEGLAISLVDARRQTPGATRFKRGCGMRPALPEAAVSVVIDTSSSDPSCDFPGTGVSTVASLEGGDAAPLVLCSSLDLSTAAYRTGEWLPLQVALMPVLQNNVLHFRPWRVWINGSEILHPFILMGSYEPAMLAANVSVQSFYVVVSARTGDTTSDSHAVSGVRVDCGSDGAIENWDGWRQPLTPPPASPPWQPPPQPAPVRSAAQVGGVSFGVALVCALALMLAAAAARHLCCSAAPPKRAASSAVGDDEAWLLVEPSLELVSAPEATFHAFLSYRRADARLVDSIHDKLRLTGLRVFKDTGGSMAGQPFDGALLRTMRAAPVFAPVVTLASLQRLGSAATQSDAFLAELLVAICMRAAGEVRLIHPLLVGPETEAGWSSLLDEPSYAAALAALPDVASPQTVALVDSTLRRAGAAPMPPHLAALTVRQVLLGRAARDGTPAVAGVLCNAPFALGCGLNDLGLYISHQYRPPIWEAAKQRAPLAR